MELLSSLVCPIHMLSNFRLDEQIKYPLILKKYFKHCTWGFATGNMVQQETVGAVHCSHQWPLVAVNTMC